MFSEKSWITTLTESTSSFPTISTTTLPFKGSMQKKFFCTSQRCGLQMNELISWLCHFFLLFWSLASIACSVKALTGSDSPHLQRITCYLIWQVYFWLSMQVCTDIATQEKMIADLKRAIKAKEDPMKVAQTRLYHREFRPKVELCRDPPQYGWVRSSLLLIKFYIHVSTLLKRQFNTSGRKLTSGD